MTLEFEASAKAAAEQKTRQQGMDVQHAAEVHDGPPVERHGSTHRGEVDAVTGMHPIVKTLLIVGVAAVAIWFGWPTVRGWFMR